MNLEDELRQAREEVDYWIGRKDGDSELRVMQLQYFRNRIAELEQRIVDQKYTASIPHEYTHSVTQTMAILVGRQLTANDIERINSYVCNTMSGDLNSLTQTQYQLLAAEVIPDYKKYLYSIGVYSQFRIDGTGKIIG